MPAGVVCRPARIRLAKPTPNRSGRCVSNFPLSYKLSWLLRLLRPSLAGGDGSFGPLAARWHEPKEVVRLVFLGDISAVANAEPPEIDPAICELIAEADLVVANCESPVVERPVFRLATRLGLRHAMTPAFLDGVLAATGISPAKLVLSLANNHVLDQGVAGFEETVSVLAKRGIRTVGAAADGLVQRVEVGPLTIGFLAFTQWRNASAAEFTGRVAMADGIAGWKEHAKAADLICAVPHWDFEFRHFPQSGTRRLARSLADEGVGLIVGGHAHVLQPVERIGGALAAYGLGDFLGTVLPRAPWPLKIGVMLSAEVSADEGTRGEVAAYRVAPFLRQRRGHRERLTRFEATEGRVAQKATRRLAAVFPDPGGQKPRKSL
jgi:poly-gamma-glutamate capsule biosynthesis protein CapA/YwtB (metallophosphatase superfamily)